MKVFVPMPDEGGSTVKGRLVPFNPEFLTIARAKTEGRKPRNWISSNDYTAAIERLARSDFATA